MRKAIEQYNMIEDGDKIAVCLSGGKDSITMLNGLKAMQRFFPKKYELIAISINPGFDNFNTELLKNVCNKADVPLFIEDSHIKEIVFDIRQEKNPCSLCANLRRGIINSIANREGCNKIAIGHNKDDALETFLLNLLYGGNISTFAPIAFMDRSKITVIRPLILTDESSVRKYIKRNNITVMDKVCPMDGSSKREDMKNMIFDLQKSIPTIRANLYGAISRNLNDWNNT